MRNYVLIALCFAAGLLGANVQPILTGAGKLLFPEAAPPASLSASSGKLTVAAGGTNQDLVLAPSGSGAIQLFADSPPIKFADNGSGQLTINGGGSGQPIVLTPAGGSGYVISSYGAAVPNNYGYVTYDSAGAARMLLALDNANPDVLHIKNNQRAAGGSISLESVVGGGQSVLIDSAGRVKIGSGAPGYTLDVAGDINTTGAFRAGGTAGVGTGSTITVCTAGACTSSCTLIFSGGLRTGGTCL